MKSRSHFGRALNRATVLISSGKAKQMSDTEALCHYIAMRQGQRRRKPFRDAVAKWKESL